MGPLTEWLPVVTFVWSILVGLLILAERYGFLRAKADASPADRTTRYEPGNGHGPTLGEVARRLQKVENEFVPRSELEIRAGGNKREHEEVWDSIKDLRAADKAIDRRIDALMREGP